VDCFDCAALSRATSAVAVCADCGAGTCPEHARVIPRWLTRIMPIGRPERAGPPARVIRCAVCQAARDAVPDAAPGDGVAHDGSP
jgi:hypothetical protein